MRKTILNLCAALALAVGAALAAWSWGARADDAPEIVIKAFAYAPKDITVTVGTKVTWINRDPEPHTVVEKGGKFRSAALDTDDSYSFTFTEPGTYSIFCSLHPQMQAKVTVVPRS